MTYTVHGDPGIIVTLLAILGALYILSGIQNWVSERISLDLHPLWHVIPRRFRVSIRWDRPHALVMLPDGHDGEILYVLEHDDAPSPVVLVQAYDEEGEQTATEWLPVTALSPVPGHSFRETVRAMHGKEDESA